MELDKWITQARDDGIPFRAVAKYCRNRGSSIDQAMQIADDASQEAFSRAVKLGPTPFECESHFRAWLTTTAKRVAVDGIRRRRREVSLNDETNILDSGSGHDYEISEALRDCVSRLEEWLRQVMVAILDELELTGREPPLHVLAAKLDLPNSTQKHSNTVTARSLRIRRARIRAFDEIRRCLESKGYPDDHFVFR